MHLFTLLLLLASSSALATPDGAVEIPCIVHPTYGTDPLPTLEVNRAVRVLKAWATPNGVTIRTGNKPTSYSFVSVTSVVYYCVNQASFSAKLTLQDVDVHTALAGVGRMCRPV
ncbi:hypothetical protein B0T14DRAFT_602331 [Immersiella caudata]|uniref:Uncharacterized protein n=1 Tax=Immersiella caudata TaxID=314043 RepID=A0AA40C3C5_9PEZI|nr:hypothetical protein B0T14DRAFT_602331 [Immersiella caudata]